MCGIVGYIGKNHALPILLEGLKRLEYRGYDSSGIAIQHNGEIKYAKTQGKIAALENKISNTIFNGSLGIAHTRWATHGEPNEVNAHPHLNSKNSIALVHNGIIENYRSIRAELELKGYKFQSETDTETLVLLIEEFHKDGTSLSEAVRLALSQVEGTYGICVISSAEPDTLFLTRKKLLLLRMVKLSK